MKDLIQSQREFFNSGATLDLKFRIARLKQFESLLKKNEKVLTDAIFNDFSKSVYDTMTNELALVYHDLWEAIKNLDRWASKKPVKTNFVNIPGRSYVVPEPLGVALIIGAWNYPYQLSLAPAVAAMAAGNTVVLKPSETPEHTSHAMATLINANFDASYFKVIEGGVEETTLLLEQKFDKIFFTGSTAVGKMVYAAAAKQMTPVTLELGGKSPAFVTEDCNLKITARRLVWSKFINAGQTCISPDYILVQKSIEQSLLSALKTEIEASRYAVENDNYVQIINAKNMHRLMHLLKSGKVYSGGAVDLENRYIEPTLLTEVSVDDEVMTEEIFGPILPVIPYDNLDEAIAQVRTRPKPLACYVFTSDKVARNKVMRGISFGGGMINDAVTHISNSNMGFGGVGESGIGKYHGESGFAAFSHYKGIIDKSTWLDPPLRYSPHTKLKLKIIRWVMK